MLGLLAGGGWVWWRGSVLNLPVREHCTAAASGSAVATGTIADLDPEQAGNAALITTIAVRRGLPARAASIGIATAMQESKLRNLDYGDRDSLGLFQQRPSQGWGTPDQILDPVYATNAFYDVLVKVEGYQDMPITKVAQRVQRSAFPSAYAQKEPEARVLASALSGYSPAGFSCVLRPVGDLPQQAAGDDGLTGRAHTLASAAHTETGATGSAGGRGGTAVRFPVAVTSGNRSAWSLAQWAVARASGLDVVAVQLGDQEWRRGRSTEGWTTADGTALPDGIVVIQVA